MLKFVTVFLTFVLFASGAEARQHRHHQVRHYHHHARHAPAPTISALLCNGPDIMRPCLVVPSVPQSTPVYAPKRRVLVAKIRPERSSRRHYARHSGHTSRLAYADPVAFKIDRGTQRISGIVAPLAAKAAEISSACGSSIISGVRHTHIAGTGRMSLHASGKAVDMQGNPQCIYAHLSGWQGGYSVDYGSVRHVHISYDADGGREWGLHFHHGGYRHYAHRHHNPRYAHRHHRVRYARA